MDLLVSCQCGAQLGAVVKCPKCGSPIELELPRSHDAEQMTIAGVTAENRVGEPPDSPPPLPFTDSPEATNVVYPGATSESATAACPPSRFRNILVNSLIGIVCLGGLMIVAVLIYASVMESQIGADVARNDEVLRHRDGESKVVSKQGTGTGQTLGKDDVETSTSVLADKAPSLDAAVNGNVITASETADQLKIGVSWAGASPPQPLIGSVSVGVNLDCIRFSPDGKYLAAGEGEYRVSGGRGADADDVKIVEVRTRRVVKSLEGLGSDALAFSPDGATLAAGGQPKLVVLWDLKVGKPRRILRGHENSITSLAFNANAEKLASSDSGGKLKVWDVTSGTEVRSFDVKRHFYFRLVSPIVQFHPNSDALMWTNDEDVTYLERDGTRRSLPVGSGVESISVLPNTMLLAATSRRETPIKVWDLASGGLIAKCGEHWKSESTVSLHPDGDILASGSANGLKIWDVSSGKVIYWHHFFNARSVNFAPNGSMIVAGSGGDIFFWNVSAIRESYRLRELAENSTGSKKDISKLQGVWSGTEGNAPIAYEFKNAKVRFGSLGAIVGDQVHEWFSYVVDAQVTPKRIDVFRESDGLRDFTMRGTYQFDWTGLRIHYARREGKVDRRRTGSRDAVAVELKRFSTIEQ